MNAVIGQDGVNTVRHYLDEVLQERPGGLSVCFFYQLRYGEPAGSVNSNKEIELAFGGPHLGNVYVKVSDRIGLEPLLDQLVACNFRQAADPWR